MLGAALPTAVGKDECTKLGPVLAETEGCPLAICNGAAEYSTVGDEVGTFVAVPLEDPDPLALGNALWASLG